MNIPEIILLMLSYLAVANWAYRRGHKTGYEKGTHEPMTVTNYMHYVDNPDDAKTVVHQGDKVVEL